MAGHNKWSKIKRKKGANDAARAARFAKASRAIIHATRACRGDMANLRLQSAVAHARNINMPKDRIEDAISRWEPRKGETATDMLTMRYDAMMNFGGTKVACLIMALSENRNRTASSVRATVTRQGGELLPTASHDYLFQKVGMALIEDLPADFDEDGLWECAMEGGATDVDVDTEEKSAVITSEPEDLWAMVEVLREKGYEPTEFDHKYVLNDVDMAVEIDQQGQERLEMFLDKFDEDPDVTNVFHNSITTDSS